MGLQSNIVSQMRNRKKCAEGFDQGNIRNVYTNHLSFVFFLHQSYLSATGHSRDEQFSRNMRPLSFITNKKETGLLNHCSRSWTLTNILLEYIDVMQLFCSLVFFFSFFFFTNNFGSCLRTLREIHIITASEILAWRPPLFEVGMKEFHLTCFSVGVCMCGCASERTVRAWARTEVYCLICLYIFQIQKKCFVISANQFQLVPLSDT